MPLAALLIINKVRALDGLVDQLLVVNVYAGLEKECLCIHISLATMVVAESVVVRAAYRQLVLQFHLSTLDAADHV